MYENVTDVDNPFLADEMYTECVDAFDTCVHEFNLTKMKTKESCSQGLGSMDPVSF